MKFIKKYKGYILAFVLPFMIYFLFFLWKGVFTDKSILTSDLLSQYQSIFQYFKNVLHGVETFPYTFSKGIGGGMWGTLFYAFSDPLNLVVYFFEDMSLFFAIIILLKLSLSGLTMYAFLKYKFKNEKEKTLLVFSLTYALMGYNVNYFMHIMWLDGVILAPLVLMGIEKMLNEKKDWTYIIALFLSICTSYYIGYMITAFSCVYFGYSYFLKNDEWKKNKSQLFHFLLVTLLVGLGTSFILLPSGLEFLNIVRIPLNGEKIIFNFNFLDFIAPTIIGFGNIINPLNFYGFLIFVGTIMMPLLICYFSNEKIKRKEKILTIITYSFLLLPIVFPPLNRLWHMSTKPMGFNYRYSFLASLFTIIIMIRSFTNLNVSKKKLIVFFILDIAFFASLIFVNRIEPDFYIYLSIPKIIITSILLGINIILLIKNKKKNILTLLMLELILNLNWIGYESHLFSSNDYSEAKLKLEQFSTKCEKKQRCETIFGYTNNDPLFANYDGVSVFLTAQNGKVLKFLNSLDVYKANSYKYHIDLALDTLLGVSRVETKFPVYGYNVLNRYNYQGVDLYLLENSNALGLGYLVSSNIKNFKSNKKGILRLEDVFNAMDSKEKNYFYKLPLKKVSDREYILEKDCTYPSLYVFTSNNFKINNTEIERTILKRSDFIILYDEYGDKLTFTFEEPIEELNIYALDVESLKEFSKDRVNLIIDSNTGNKIESHIGVKEASTLFTTIPYEKGWEVIVDGEKVKSYEALNTFLAIDLEEGEHTVTFKYHIYGLKEGIFISVISLLFLCGYEYRYKKVTSFKNIL